MKKGFLYTFVICAILTICMVFNASPVIAQVYMNSDGTILTSGNASQNKGISNLGQGTQSSSTNGNEDGWFTNGMQSLVLAIMIYGSKFIAWIVSFAGDLFDKVIKYTTVFPKDLELGITASWKIIRDFSNIILVFSLLYLGIKTILEGNGFADKKVLIGIIIAAIMINFSFFFVKDVAFNVSNTIGLQILQQANLSGEKAGSFSEGLMGMVNPQKVLDNNHFPGTWGAYNIAEQKRTDWDLIFKMMGQMIMFTAVVISMAFVFLGASVILLYRFFIFIILMIFAPIGLISTQIPWLQKIGKDWWEQLKKQTLFFPAFSLVLYIVLLIVSTLASLNPDSINGTAGDTVFRFLFNFILIMGFMFALLILPGKLGTAGSGLMTNAGGYIKNKAKSLPRSAGNFAGQKTLNVAARTGRYLVGNKFANKLGGNTPEARKALQLQAQSGGFTGLMAQQRLKSSESLKGKTFDVRNTKTGAKLGMGKGIESYSKAVKAKSEEYEKKKKDEMKLFGFDKAHETDENKLEIAKHEVKRKNTEASYKSAEIAYTANPNSVTLDDMKKAEKDLEVREKKIGELKNIGEQNWDKQNSAKWRTKLSNLSATRSTAAQEAREKAEKKWKEAGQSPSKKQRRANEARVSSALTSPSSVITPPSPATP